MSLLRLGSLVWSGLVLLGCGERVCNGSTPLTHVESTPFASSALLSSAGEGLVFDFSATLEGMPEVWAPHGAPHDGMLDLDLSLGYAPAGPPANGDNEMPDVVVEVVTPGRIGGGHT